MQQFFIDIASFTLQTVVIVVALLIVIGFIASLMSKGKEASEVKITHINKRLKGFKKVLDKTLMSKKDLKKKAKAEKNIKAVDPKKPNAFVIRFEGDIKASATDQFREEITTVLMTAQKEDQVVIDLESPGGIVHGYGFAASQMERIKQKGIPLVACVDKVAASGGYMMASVADKIIAAPFSIIGSIGVVASLPNFNKVLKKNDVEYLEITAGDYKRTLTPLGEITDQGMSKFKEQIEEVHVLFKNHVMEQRPQVDIQKVSTGEYWYAKQAIEMKLVDELNTSDDYILSLSETHNIFKVSFQGKKTFKEKLAEGLGSSTESLLNKLSTRLWSQRFH